MTSIRRALTWSLGGRTIQVQVESVQEDEGGMTILDTWIPAASLMQLNSEEVELLCSLSQAMIRKGA